ncbi:MAG TPA: hypothetical protein VH853_11450 [Polyangia bacterium]|nr:hypothetical protein [Polyangia bacterium]
MLLHAPVESQVPAQRPETGSSALVTGTQLPAVQARCSDWLKSVVRTKSSVFWASVP